MKTIKIGDNLKLLGRFRDDDGTEKFVFESAAGIIEITWIKNKKGITVFCLPTHHYCSLGCKFCHLTEERRGINKKMIPIKAEDLNGAMDYVVKKYAKNKKILLSFMGVGEPFLNLDLIFRVFDLNKKKKGFAFSYALASMMPSEAGFKKIYQKVKTDKLPLKIHFSLHSPFDKTRQEIIPSSKETIGEVLGRLKKYEAFIKTQPEIINNLSQFHNSTAATKIHYTVIKDINDSEKDLHEVIGLGKKFGVSFKILKFNPTASLKRSDREQHWLERLTKEYGAPVKYYAPPGLNIGSSCGQFTKHYYLGSQSGEQMKEFKQWKKKYEVK
jgi:Predicted Fe-S-cluster redox enzyme